MNETPSPTPDEDAARSTEASESGNAGSQDVGSQDAASQDAGAPVKPTTTKALRPLRAWPVPVLIAVMLLARWSPMMVQDGPEWFWMIQAFVPALSGFLILAWFVTFSRASWAERAIGFVGCILLYIITMLVVDPSIQGPAAVVVTVPMGFTGFGLALVVQAKRLTFQRTWIALLVAMVCFGFSGLLRAEGLWGDFSLGLDWRWNPSAEERFLAELEESTLNAATGDAGNETAAIEAAPEQLEALTAPQWPGFRGPNRDGVQHGSQLATDWDQQAPEALWKIRVGPGWSSFAVAGDLLYTMEQRGEEETVVCYDASNGLPIWTQAEAGRLEDPLGGPGPRATPTVADGALYATGAMGWLMRLDPLTGDIVWKANILQDSGREKKPEWGFCASPLVMDGNVIVHVGGDGDLGVLAYDAETGELAWSAAAGDHSYGSVQALEVGERQVAGVLTNAGVSLYDPASGDVLLHHAWKSDMYRCLQPIVTDDDRLFIPSGMGVGTRALQLTSGEDSIEAKELWTSRDLKSDYSDCVLVDDHLYGFDGAIFACVNAADGKKQWKQGRYGKGQVLYAADSQLLVVLSEYGEVALVKADPSGHEEVARFQAIKGKTWNHPVLVGDRLFVRNSEEAAAYRLPLK